MYYDSNVYAAEIELLRYQLDELTKALEKLVKI